MSVANVTAGAGITEAWGDSVADAIDARDVIAYAAVTANQTGITTAIDLTGLTVTWTADGSTRYLISFYCNVLSTVATDNIIVDVVNGTSPGGSTVTRASIVPGLGGFGVSLVGSVYEVGISGSQTRRLVARRNSGSGSVSLDAAGTYPAYIMVQAIGNI